MLSTGKRNGILSTQSIKRRKGCNTIVDIPENHDNCCNLCIIRKQLEEMKSNIYPVKPSIIQYYVVFV